MNLLHLSLLTLALSVCVVLAVLNPTIDDYLAFVEGELGNAIDRSDLTDTNRERAMVRNIFRSHSHEIVNSMVRPHTIRRNWGVASLYETTVLDSRTVVLGLAGRFIPIKGVDETVVRLGRMAF